jgi:hypothetical protein
MLRYYKDGRGVPCPYDDGLGPYWVNKPSRYKFRWSG